jgi:outer membrane lipoprotein-sorting protein
MRLLTPLLLAVATWAEPYLPLVAQKVPVDGCRIRLDWISAPAGTIAPPSSVTGNLELASDDRFRFSSPELVVVSDGRTLSQWNASTNQVLLRSAARADASALPSGLLQAALTGAEISSTTEKLDGKSVHKLVLDVSKPPLSKFVHATLWARESDDAPVRLEVADSQGGTITWKILSVSSWKASDKDFRYVPPKGAEVVDSR